MELEPWFLPRFPAHFSPQGFFVAGFFLASVLTAFALLAVAQLYLPWVPEVFLERFPVSVIARAVPAAFGRHFRPPFPREKPLVPRVSSTRFFVRFLLLFVREVHIVIYLHCT